MVKPEEISDSRGSLENAKLKTMDTSMTPARVLFSFAGGMMIARNIP